MTIICLGDKMEIQKKDFEEFCKNEHVVILVDAKKSGQQHQETYTGVEVSVGWFLRNIKNAKKVVA